MSRKQSNENTRLLPFPVIEAAASGDVGAINKVLKHYEGYIIALSTRRMFDESGNPHFIIDNEFRRTLETRLIVNVLQFDLDRAA
jgi:hypothetical protein